jgi:hypothetical protein
VTYKRTEIKKSLIISGKQMQKGMSATRREKLPKRARCDGSITPVT